MNPLSLITAVVMLLATTPALAQYAPDTVLVSLGDAQVRVADVDAAARQLPKAIRSGVFDDPQRIGSLLETMVVRRAIVGGIVDGSHESELDVAAEQTRQSHAVLTRMQLEIEMDALPQPDFAAQAGLQYEQRKNEFTTPETVNVRHVLIGTRQRPEAEAKDLAEKLRNELTDSQLTFDQAVARYSDDPASAGNGGLYENVRRGQMVPGFEAAAFALPQPGALSAPVKTNYGYHLIRLESRQSARQLSLEEVRPQLESELQQDFRRSRERLVRARLGADAERILLQRAKTNGLMDDPIYPVRVRLALEEATLRWYRDWYLRSSLKGDFQQLAREYHLTHPEEFNTAPVVLVVEVFVPEDNDPDEATLKAQHARTLAADLAGAQLLLASPPPGVAASQQRYVEGEDESLAARLGLALYHPGQTSEIVSVSGGLLFVSMLVREPPRPQRFEEISEMLTTRLRAQQELKLWTAHVNEFHQLPSNANADAIASLRTRYIGG